MPAKRRFTDAEKAEILRAFQETFETTPEIGIRFNVSDSVVGRNLKTWLGEENYLTRRSERARFYFGGERHGCFGKPKSAETRRKIGEARKGQKHTPESLEKMRLVHTGVRHSEETKEKCRQSKLGLYTGRKASLETRAKQSLARKGLKRSPEAIAATAAGHRGQKRSMETRAKQSENKAKQFATGALVPNFKKTAKGVYVSNKDDTQHHYDSGWELTRMKELDAQDVSWNKHHGVIIPYLDASGNPRRYVPDFLVYDNETAETRIEEVKGWKTALDIAKFAEAERFCAERNWRFVVLDKSHFAPSHK